MISSQRSIYLRPSNAPYSRSRGVKDRILVPWRVAFGIMGGFLFNLIFVSATKEGQSELTVALILASPMVPSLVLFCILIFCPESPRYYMRQGSPRYSPKKAFDIFSKLRSCEVSPAVQFLPMSESSSMGCVILTFEHISSWL